MRLCRMRARISDLMSTATLEKLKKKERAARRELILLTARKLFAEKDFRSVTVREIAKKAGVSPGTIYRYYKNLDALFLDVFFAGAHEIMERLADERSKDSGCSLNRFCEIYISYLNENISYYQMMGHFMLGGKLSPEATEKLNPIIRDLMSLIEGIIRETGRTGDTRLMAHALFSALNGIMISYSGYPGRDPEKVNLYTKKLGSIVADVFKAKLKR